MTISCQTITVYKFSVEKGKTIKLDSVKFVDQIISYYEWTINSVINSNITSSLTIDTNNLPLGINTISHRVKNSCGNWSEYVIKNINIICSPLICEFTTK